MAIKTIVKTGIYTFEVEAKDEKELIQQVSFLSKIESECPICGAEVRLDYRTPQGFQYYSRHCTGPIKHEKDFGQNKPDKGGGLFDRDDEQWIVALTAEEWKKRAQGGPSYKCEICGTNDNSAHRTDCPNNTSGDQVVHPGSGQKRRDTTAPEAQETGQPGKPLSTVDETGPIIEPQIEALRKIYDRNEWPHKDFGSWTFKKASKHIQDCTEQESIRNAS